MSDIERILDYLARDGYGTPIGVLESVPAARLELAQLRRAVEARDQALLDALRTWSFDDGQQHTHSWHDRQDWIERHRAILAEIDGKDGERG